MINKQELCKFLVKAKRATYASGDSAQKIINDDKSTTLVFEDEDWKSLHAAVHQMIPSFSIMGISHDFENMARTIQEYAGIQQQSDVIPALVLQLANICTQSCVELKEEYEMIKSLQI